MGPIGAAAIAAGQTILGTGTQAYAQGRMNKKTRQWNEKMYGIQRKDALADWNMMNAYNSPAEQMARFKAAGLNPNLIYGQQNDGSVVRSTDVKSWNPSPADYQGGIQRGVGTYFDIQMNKQTISNMEAQKRLTEMQIAKVGADIANLGVRTASGEFKLGQDKALYDYVMRTAESNMFKADYESDIAHYRRDILQNTADLQIKQANQKLLNMILENQKSDAQRQHIMQSLENMKKDGILRDFEIQLNKMGITKGDNTWLRMITTLLGKYGIKF